ncbi:hypothetical protein ZWY2020_059187 [Hordeum vulgare]|nr:hypothetical protein ZWY2020_059187 [Hordeum vulgare]
MDRHVGCGEAAVLRPWAVRQERPLRVPTHPAMLLRAGVRDGGPTTNCSTSEKQSTFVKLAHTDFYGYDLGFNQSVTFQYCKSTYFCSCAAFQYRADGKGNCYPKGILFNGYTSPTSEGTIYLKLPSHINASVTPTSTVLDCNQNAAIVPPTYADT